MCTVLLPPSVKPFAVNKTYFISHISSTKQWLLA